jgi:hypothetical protein
MDETLTLSLSRRDERVRRDGPVEVGLKPRLILGRWNLTAWLKENPCQAGEEPRTTLTSTVEAIIGAVWIDCNRIFRRYDRL